MSAKVHASAAKISADWVSEELALYERGDPERRCEHLEAVERHVDELVAEVAQLRSRHDAEAEAQASETASADLLEEAAS